MPESLPGATTALREELAQSEEGFAAARLTIAEMVGEKIQLEEALAAARRECEGLKRVSDALIEKIYSLVRGPDIVDEVLRICRKAIASPAAGEEGTR